MFIKLKTWFKVWQNEKIRPLFGRIQKFGHYSVESQNSAEVRLIPVIRFGRNRTKERKIRHPVKRNEFFENKIRLRFRVPITPLRLLFTSPHGPLIAGPPLEKESPPRVLLHTFYHLVKYSPLPHNGAYYTVWVIFGADFMDRDLVPINGVFHY